MVEYLSRYTQMLPYSCQLLVKSVKVKRIASRKKLNETNQLHQVLYATQQIDLTNILDEAIRQMAH